MPARAELIDAVVARIPPWQGCAVAVEPLPGGMTNESYRVTVGERRYVVRLAVDDPALLGVDRENERHNTEIAAGLGIGPRVVAHIAELGALVVEFTEGRSLTAAELRRPGMPVRLARTLKALHGGPRFHRPFDMFRLIDDYLGTLDRLDAPLPPRYRERLPTLRRVERALRARPWPAEPCHNDLVAENVIDEGQTLRLVDWEYSGNGDPAFELGSACRELEYDEGTAALLLSQYAGVDSPVALARLHLFGVVADAGWTLWASIQAARARLDLDFAAYGARRWARTEAALDAPDLSAWLDASARMV